LKHDSITPTGTFTLRTTFTSPYGRKVRIAADILNLSDRITIVPANTIDETDSLRLQNPLGKMPCLLLPDGEAIYDSRVIVEYLQELAGSEQFLPARGEQRYRILTEATLADGITDAALLMTYEPRFHASEMISQPWLEYQRGKIERALAVFETDPPAPATDLVAITLACALGYLDWRKQVDWRATSPRLVAWLEAFSEREPAFGRSEARTDSAV
jgi:glutathione S-transferase